MKSLHILIATVAVAALAAVTLAAEAPRTEGQGQRRKAGRTLFRQVLQIR